MSIDISFFSVMRGRQERASRTARLAVDYEDETRRSRLPENGREIVTVGARRNKDRG
ncbi:hypothetical protein [Stenotrophomonas sp. ZAC14D2_NAIMI4_7]|uniref:hypothetical protein n=1 Tax=Stenotrophomonas sp. ZAC14D2_NAIMI4_7 TaxID=2072405 RepID=UPI00131EF001|nr:hypothetical protein [Stenotrophomonas sp. ZAC14D2_NAIMI4_7]